MRTLLRRNGVNLVTARAYGAHNLRKKLRKAKYRVAKADAKCTGKGVRWCLTMLHNTT